MLCCFVFTYAPSVFYGLLNVWASTTCSWERMQGLKHSSLNTSTQVEPQLEKSGLEPASLERPTTCSVSLLFCYTSYQHFLPTANNKPSQLAGLCEACLLQIRVQEKEVAWTCRCPLYVHSPTWT